MYNCGCKKGCKSGDCLRGRYGILPSPPVVLKAFSFSDGSAFFFDLIYILRRAVSAVVNQLSSVVLSCHLFKIAEFVCKLFVNWEVL